MVRCGRYKLKTYCFRAVVLFMVTFLCLKISYIGTFANIKSNPHDRVYSIGVLQEIRSLIRNSKLNLNEEVQDYFSWPTPQNPTMPADVTDPKQSSYKIHYADHVYTHAHNRVGNDLIIEIVARNGKGEQKAFGGDYFKVILTSKDLRNSIVGSIKDHNDGTYTAKIPLTFSGQANLQVILINPSEAIDLLRRVISTKRSPGLIFYGVFQDKMSQEEKECNVWLPSMPPNTTAENKHDYCNFTHKSGEAWFCEKPRYLDCSNIQLFKIKRTDDAAAVLEKSNLFKKETNLRVQVGKIIQLTIDEKGSNQVLFTPLKCTLKTAGSLPPRPGGYFENDIWQSRHCASKNFVSSVQRAKCLQNKLIVLLGDSTIRQWYANLCTGGLTSSIERFSKLAHNLGFATKMQARERTITPTTWEPREAVDSVNNITIKFSAHGPPLQNGGTPNSMPYIADRLDSLRGGADTVVAISIGPHLLLYEPTVYIKRLLSIKKAIERLLSRAPETLILFRGFNVYYMDDLSSNQCCLFDWLAFRLDTIARNIFGKMTGVIYLDMWDLSSSHYSIPVGLHVQKHVVQNEVSLFLSFICPDL